MMHRDHLGPFLIWLVATTGCGAGWHRPAALASGALKPRQQVQVWQGRTVFRWHAVVIGPDTISGLPFYRPTDCDSCRTGLTRATVDSIRLGNPVAGFWKSVALTLGALFAYCYAQCPRGME